MSVLKYPTGNKLDVLSIVSDEFRVYIRIINNFALDIRNESYLHTFSVIYRHYKYAELGCYIRKRMNQTR